MLSQAASLRARRNAVIRRVMPPWGSWLTLWEHALRLTALRLAESAISYDAVHWFNINRTLVELDTQHSAPHVIPQLKIY